MFGDTVPLGDAWRKSKTDTGGLLYVYREKPDNVLDKGSCQNPR